MRRRTSLLPHWITGCRRTGAGVIGWAGVVGWTGVDGGCVTGGGRDGTGVTGDGSTTGALRSRGVMTIGRFSRRAVVLTHWALTRASILAIVGRATAAEATVSC